MTECHRRGEYIIVESSIAFDNLILEIKGLAIQADKNPIKNKNDLFNQNALIAVYFFRFFAFVKKLQKSLI